MGDGMGAGGLVLAHALLAAAYAGFQVLVQVVVYRSFPLVPAAAFVPYVQAHQRRIGYVVGPLFAGLLATTTLLVLRRPYAAPTTVTIGAAGLLAAVLGLTALGAVPAHRRLSAGFDPATYDRLIAVDGLRTAAAAANAGLGAALAWAALATPTGGC